MNGIRRQAKRDTHTHRTPTEKRCVARRKRKERNMCRKILSRSVTSKDYHHHHHRQKKNLRYAAAASAEKKKKWNPTWSKLLLVGKTKQNSSARANQFRCALGTTNQCLTSNCLTGTVSKFLAFLMHWSWLLYIRRASLDVAKTFPLNEQWLGLNVDIALRAREKNNIKQQHYYECVWVFFAYKKAKVEEGYQRRREARAHWRWGIICLSMQLIKLVQHNGQDSSSECGV